MGQNASRDEYGDVIGISKDFPPEIHEISTDGFVVIDVHNNGADSILENSASFYSSKSRSSLVRAPKSDNKDDIVVIDMNNNDVEKPAETEAEYFYKGIFLTMASKSFENITAEDIANFDQSAFCQSESFVVADETYLTNMSLYSDASSPDRTHNNKTVETSFNNSLKNRFFLSPYGTVSARKLNLSRKPMSPRGLNSPRSLFSPRSLMSPKTSSTPHDFFTFTPSATRGLPQHSHCISSPSCYLTASEGPSSVGFDQTSTPLPKDATKNFRDIQETNRPCDDLVVSPSILWEPPSTPRRGDSGTFGPRAMPAKRAAGPPSSSRRRGGATTRNEEDRRLLEPGSSREEDESPKSGGSAASRTDQPSPDRSPARSSARSSARPSGSPKASATVTTRTSAGEYQQHHRAGNGNCSEEVIEDVKEIGESSSETAKKGQELSDKEVSDNYCPDESGREYQALTFTDRTTTSEGSVSNKHSATRSNPAVNCAKDEPASPQQRRSSELLAKPSRSRSRTASSEITTTSAVSASASAASGHSAASSNANSAAAAARKSPGGVSGKSTRGPAVKVLYYQNRFITIPIDDKQQRGGSSGSNGAGSSSAVAAGNPVNSPVVTGGAVGPVTGPVAAGAAAGRSTGPATGPAAGPAASTGQIQPRRQDTATTQGGQPIRGGQENSAMDLEGMPIDLDPVTPAQPVPRFGARGLAKTQSVLQKITAVLQDNRLKSGSESTQEQIKEMNKNQDESHKVLKKILNIIFITTGVSLFLGVVVVIIYTSLGKPDSETEVSTISANYTEATPVLSNETLWFRSNEEEEAAEAKGLNGDEMTASPESNLLSTKKPSVIETFMKHRDKFRNKNPNKNKNKNKKKRKEKTTTTVKPTEPPTPTPIEDTIDYYDYDGIYYYYDYEEGAAVDDRLVKEVGGAHHTDVQYLPERHRLRKHGHRHHGT